MQYINVNVEQQDPRPAAIYIVVTASSELSVGCAYDTHSYPLKLFDRNYDNYFRYCLPCKFRRMKVCPGGEKYLFSADTYLSMTTPDRRQLYRSNSLSCEAQKQDLLDVKKNVDTTQVVKLPAYVLWSRCKDYSDYYWWVLNPNASSIPEMWSGIPFPFSNVHPSGQICYGDVEFDDRYDSAELQSKILNGRFNTDLRTYEPQFKTLGSYARALTAAPNQVEFLNQFVGFDYRGFCRNMLNLNRAGCLRKAIVAPTYKRIEWDHTSLRMWDLSGDEFILNENNEVVEG